MNRVQLGCELLFSSAAHTIRGRRVGLITNHSGVDSQLRATADKLHQSQLCELVALYGPEHGIRGAAQDGAKVDNAADP
ncbi:MAG: exo-beta-N-acetylmuramidase NamZ domain-containing protein, partial [Candidatus Latescibacterota bacterium]